jgi:photosystem II stability/assembly factor-like uncharacterized protein
MNSFKYFGFALIFLFSCAENNQATKESAKRLSDYGPADHLWERWTYPNETFDVAYFDKVIEDVKLQMLQKGGNDVSWRVEGPTNIGGRINCVALNPDNESEIFIGTSAGGVFRSSNAGGNWESIGNDFLSMAIGAIAFNPQNTQEIYVGTGDPNISGTPKTGNGVYKSIDGGDTWELLGMQEVGVVSKILVHPTQSNIVFMASMGTPYYEDENRGVYKSMDGGDTWNQILFLSTQSGVSSLVFHPDFPDTLYAGGWDRIRNNQVSITSGIHGRVYRSFDGGANWMELSGGLPDGELVRAAVDVSISNPAVVYASFVNPSNMEFEGIYRSDNYGDTWQATNIFNLDGALGGFGWYFGQIRVDPTDENNVSVAGVELHSTINGGDSWFQSTPDWWLYEVHADMHDLVYNSQGDIWLATDGGLYSGDEAFEGWEYSSFIPISQFYRIAVNPHETEIYAGGMQDNGTSEGNYENLDDWPRLLGGDGFQPIYDPSDPNVAYGTIQNGNLRTFVFGGWNGFTDGIGGERVAWDAPFIMSSHNTDVLYTGTQMVYRADEGPFSFWEPISDELNGDPIFLPANRHVITTIAESPIDENVLYAGTSDGKVWVTQNQGETWSEITAGLPDRYVTDIIASGKSAGSVYVTHSGYKDGDDLPHIHASNDFGVNWNNVAGDLPDLGINNVEIMSETNDSVLFVATDGGVYFSKNSGENWERAGNNMPIILVFDIEIDLDANRLVAGTFSRSIQTISIDSLLYFTTGINEFENETQFIVYPNPANEFLNIKSSSHSININWQIADLNGRIVKTGSGIEQPIDIQDLTPGSYIFIPEAGQRSKFLKVDR